MQQIADRMRPSVESTKGINSARSVDTHVTENRIAYVPWILYYLHAGGFIVCDSGLCCCVTLSGRVQLIPFV